MSRNQKFRANRWTHPIASIVVAGLVATNGQAALAAPTNPSDSQIQQANTDLANADNVLQALVADMAARERRVADLELQIGEVRESVNKAMVDLQEARNKADAARAALDAARTTLDTSRKELRKAQKQFDQIAVSVMRQGYSVGSAFNGAKDAAEALNRSAAFRREAEKQQKTVDSLDKTRTESANNEASLRKAATEAESAEKSAQTRNDEAQAAYESANKELQTEQASYQQAQNDREAARASLDAARKAVDQLNSQRKEYESDQARKEAENAAAREAAQKAAQEVRERANSSENTTSSSANSTSNTTGGTGTSGTANSTNSAGTTDATAGTGSTDSTQSTDTTSTTDSGTSSTDSSASGSSVQTKSPSNPESKITGSNASSSAKVETVIARAMSQLGTPYAWGGGDANGPTKGIRDGGVADAHGDYNKVGFDCSGLTLYAYAAVGITLPHYTGYQYQKGTHYPASQMKRGDLIFYGPNGHGHVAIYLGNGTMIEAPQSGDVVKISQVRYNGMTPNVVRLV